MPDSTPPTRLKQIQDTYLDAMRNRPNDLAKAETNEEREAVRANYVTAKDTYFAAAAADLSENGQAVEDAYDALSGANNAVVRARKDLVAFTELFGKMGNATEKAGELLAKAQKAIG